MNAATHVDLVELIRLAVPRRDLSNSAYYLAILEFNRHRPEGEVKWHEKQIRAAAEICPSEVQRVRLAHGIDRPAAVLEIRDRLGNVEGVDPLVVYDRAVALDNGRPLGTKGWRKIHMRTAANVTIAQINKQKRLLCAKPQIVSQIKQFMADNGIRPEELKPAEIFSRLLAHNDSPQQEVKWGDLEMEAVAGVSPDHAATLRRQAAEMCPMTRLIVRLLDASPQPGRETKSARYVRALAIQQAHKDGAKWFHHNLCDAAGICRSSGIDIRKQTQSDSPTVAAIRKFLTDNKPPLPAEETDDDRYRRALEHKNWHALTWSPLEMRLASVTLSPDRIKIRRPAGPSARRGPNGGEAQGD